MKTYVYYPHGSIAHWNLKRMALVVFAVGMAIGMALSLLAFGNINAIQIVNLVVMAAGVCALLIGPLWIAQQAYVAFGGRSHSG